MLIVAQDEYQTKDFIWYTNSYTTEIDICI